MPPGIRQFLDISNHALLDKMGSAAPRKALIQSESQI